LRGGQTLTNEYAITYQEEKCTKCEVSVQAKASVPQVVGANVFLGHGLQNASASLGFEVIQKKSNAEGPQKWYSVYLEIEESFPMKILRRPLFSRLVQMHR
jgi:hypothetical protein